MQGFVARGAGLAAHESRTEQPTTRHKKGLAGML